MGTIFFIGCRDCNVFRDLDKFYTMRDNITTRADALEYAEIIKKGSFRVGLLVSFLGEHIGHNCITFTEHDDIWQEFIATNAQKEDKFWIK